MFVTIETRTNSSKPEPRNVTLSYSENTGETHLLGNLPHGTEIIITQDLIDGLSAILSKEVTK